MASADEGTLTVPPEYVEALRANLFGCLAGEGDNLKVAEVLAWPEGERATKIGADGPPTENEIAGQCATDTYVYAGNVAAWTEMLMQLGWTDPVKGEPYTLKADSARLERVLEGALTDAGVEFARTTERFPFEIAALDRAKARAEWFAFRLGEFAVV